MKINTILLLAFFIATTMVACGVDAASDPSKRMRLGELVAKPEKFNGMRVIVDGCVRADRHTTVLFDCAAPEFGVGLEVAESVINDSDVDKFLNEVYKTWLMKNKPRISATIVGIFKYDPQGTPGFVLELQSVENVMVKELD